MFDFFPSPQEIIEQLPLPAKEKLFRDSVKSEIGKIAFNQSNKLLLIVGPCSIHHYQGALEYAEKLAQLKNQVDDLFTIVMRVHVEKPRTKIGWHGYLYDPDLNYSNNIEKGLISSRKLMIEILKLGLPIATEILDPLMIPYFEDLLSFATIGARTIHSAPHRLAFSDISIPAGFKNRIDGDITSAVAAIEFAQTKQTLLKLHSSGRLIKKQTPGNPISFLILRGSEKSPNYSLDCIMESKKIMDQAKLNGQIIVDCSHGNKKGSTQELVFKKVLDDFLNFQSPIKGLSLESYIQSGRFSNRDLSQAPKDLSITDDCLSFEKTELLILEAYSNVMSSNHSLCLNAAITSPSNVVRSAR